MSQSLRVSVSLGNRDARADLMKPIDIGITPNVSGNLNCFHAPELTISPFKHADFIGDTRNGSPVNFMNIQCNPHGNGTHTECVGHISEERIYLPDCHKDFHFVAFLTTVTPILQLDGDYSITSALLNNLNLVKGTKGLIIRTLPNEISKKYRQYSGTNPPYVTQDAIDWLVSQNIEHLLVDIPSIDKEQDGGKLVAHKSFWKFPHQTRKNATITELIYVPDEVQDGYFLVNLQYYPFPMDASPSRPVLYALH
jgi:kynurenine formamidase